MESKESSKMTKKERSAQEEKERLEADDDKSVYEFVKKFADEKRKKE